MKHTNSKKRGRAYSVFSLVLLFGSLVELSAFAAIPGGKAINSDPETTCDLKTERPRLHTLLVKKNDAGKLEVIPRGRHVCPGDIVRWHSPDKNFAISFVDGNPMYGSCGVSIAKFLTCVVRHDAKGGGKHYPYNAVETEPGFAGVDPHIIVD